MFKKKKEKQISEKIGKYDISKHAKERMQQSNIRISKVRKNLFSKPLIITAIKLDNMGRPSYNRVGEKITTSINPDSNVVSTVHGTHLRTARKYNENIGDRKWKRLQRRKKNTKK